MTKPKLAAIDIGTNSFHLVIVEVDIDTGKFKILGREKEIVRLGSGSSDMKYLTEEAIARGIDTLRRFKGLADSAEAPIRAIATSAVREANNQNDFINLVREATGIKIEVASGVEEARYIYLGVLQALPVFNKKILMIDIGGGSTEFLIGHQRKIIYDISLKLGAMRLTQRFFRNGETDAKSIRDCRKFIAGYMSPVTRQCLRHGFETVVGSSGTITNIANIINVSRGGKEDTRLNNFTFHREELYNIVEQIIEARTVKQRMKIPGLDPARADIIAAGALILEQIFKEIRIKELTVSEFALREGIIFDSIEKQYSLKKDNHLSDIRFQSIMHTAENFKFEKEHSLHTTSLALKIFDQTIKLHKLGIPEREYLESAGILHEIGLFISLTQHHKHSYYLVRNSELLGFTENEKEIIANIARYHRKSHPKPKHTEFMKLSLEDQETVKKLAGILRVADGLDRTHLSVVKNVECKISEGEVTMSLSGDSNLELEIWGAESKKALFEEAFGVKVKFEVI